MAIPEADIKLLWGKAAGRCAFPGCGEDCCIYLRKTGDAILGEMAHVIARSTLGPRGKADCPGEDVYDNLILLCPTHHRMVDKAPEDFPPGSLLQWKKQHENGVATSLTAPAFNQKSELYAYVRRLLAQNRLVHQQFGPESQGAQENPLSEGSLLWDLRKCDTVIPNNSKIVNAFERNSTVVPATEWQAFVDFREHAFAFERNGYCRLDRALVPRFPAAFDDVVREWK